MRINKLVVFILLALLLCLLVSCGGGKTPPDATDTTGTDTVSEPASDPASEPAAAADTEPAAEPEPPMPEIETDPPVADVPLDAYDIKTGAYIGRGRVKAVLAQSPKQIVLEEPLPGLDKSDGVRVAFVSLATPGSQIIDCCVKGTVRFRGPITVKNTTFDILEMWEMVEGDTEGPIPRDVVFENCTFKHGVITCDALNRGTNKSLPDIARQIGITFTDCTFEKGVRIEKRNGAVVNK